MISKHWVIALMLVVALLSGGAAIASAQESSPPGAPASFYGTVTDEDGTPAPEGTTIAAVVDGEVEATITVEAAGEYGGPESDDDKLRVDTNAGDTVAFHVNGPDGPQAGTASLDEADVYERDLTFPAGTFEDDGTVSSGSSPVDSDGSAEVDLSTGGGSTQSVRVTLPSNAGADSVSVSESTRPTGNAPEPTNRRISTYLDISASSNGNSVEVNDEVEVSTTVSESALDNAGITPENAALLHYVDGSWTELDTESSTQNSQVTLTATATGLSPFAVAESSSTDDNDGTDGTDGTDGGTDGTDGGTDGTDGGTDGTDDGSDGTDGTDDGSDGTDGTDDGSDGTDGTDDGSDGTDGTDDGTDGTDGGDGGDGDGGPGGLVIALGVLAVVIIGAVALFVFRDN